MKTVNKVKKHKVSIVVPVYYNCDSLQELYEKLCHLASSNDSMDIEIVFIDDCSGDDSFEVIRKIAVSDTRVTALRLSRNFGSFVACLAGLSHCTGDCAVIISADLQDPPELIATMYEKWLENNKIVLAVRDGRKDSFLTIFFAKIFYKIFRTLVTKDMPKNGFDFVLIDREIINILISIQEKNTTLMGLILWMGFKRAEITYTKAKRKYGKSKWTLNKKIDYFIDSIMAFSKFPIRVFTMFGIFLSFISFVAIIYILIASLTGLIHGVPGWPSLMAVNLFLFGILFLGLGIIGEYIWRNLEETRKRPLYLIDKHYRRSEGETL